MTPVLLALSLPPVALAAFFAVTQARWRAYVRHKRLALAPWRLRDVVDELVAFARVGAWRLLAGADALRRPARMTGRPVVCVHGVTQDGTNLWGIRRALEARGRPTLAVSLGRLGRPVEAYVPRLLDALRTLDAPDGFDVVAHSMGGVVLRMALAADSALAARVRAVVTLGSPHAGTAALRGLPRWLELADLRRRAPLLTGLPALSALAPHAAIVTVAGHRDAIVYPPEACHEPRARAITLPRVGHAGLLVAPEAVGAVVEALTAAA